MSEKHKGLFVVYEGNEGLGKTTQVAAVAKRLRELGIPAIATREPGGTPTGEAIRGVLCQTFEDELSPNTTTKLMFAQREQHVLNLILPKLAEGYVVISDRYIDSGYALQVVGEGADPELFEYLQTRMLKLCCPDVVFVFQGSVATSRERSAGAGRGGIERFDKMEDAQRTRVNDAYNSLLERPGYIAVDAEGSVTEITDRLVRSIQSKLLVKQAQESRDNDTDPTA